MLLPRRTNTWPAQLKCRHKGKAVIVRVAQIQAGGWGVAQAGSLYQTVRRLLSVVALVAALAALALIVQDQRELRETDEASPIAVTAGVEAPRQARSPVQGPPASNVETGRYRVLSDYVASRYRVSQDVAFNLVRLAYQAGREVQVDPLLIIAVMAIESSFNPIAESRAGAKGLMQIIPKYHGDKLEVFGGEQAIFDPATNIQVGARILREYIRNTGNVGIALQMYAGALGDHEDQYTNKVLGMKQRLQYVASQTPSRLTMAAPIRTASARTAHSSGLAID